MFDVENFGLNKNKISKEIVQNLQTIPASHVRLDGLVRLSLIPYSTFQFSNMYGSVVLPLKYTHFAKPYRFIVRNQTCVFSFTHSFSMCAKRFSFLFLFAIQWFAERPLGWQCIGLGTTPTVYNAPRRKESTWTRTMDKVFDMYFRIVITAISLWDKSNCVFAEHILETVLAFRLTTKIPDVF